jgi:hypothetical protein
VDFDRSDQAPYNFQPLKVEPSPATIQGFLGQQATVRYAVTNQDVYNHCYYWEVSVPEGYSFVTSSGSPFCVSAGAIAYPEAYFTPMTNDLPGGISGEFNATFTEVEEGRIVGGASVKGTHFRNLAAIELQNPGQATYLRPNNTDAVTITALLIDDQGGHNGWSGFLGYELATTLGTVSAPTGAFENGRMPIRFTTGNQSGDALITVNVEGTILTTTLRIREPFATQIDLVATPTDLTGNVNASALVATVRDDQGDPVVGHLVRLSVGSDDGAQGTIAGSEVFTGTTNANGQVTAAFQKGEQSRVSVVVRAEAIIPDGAGYRTTQEDIATLFFEDVPSGNSIRLPWLRR